MSLSNSLCLVIIVLCHYVALEDPKRKEHNQKEDIETLAEEDKQGLAQYSDEITPGIFHWPSGIVPYYIEPENYDEIIANRIRIAMHAIESSSCVVFKNMEVKPPPGEQATLVWLSIQNPEGIRECSHVPLRGSGNNAVLILGYDCMQLRDILHALLHVLGFKDEVTHPQRDMYIRIIWSNIQPKYRSLFWMRADDPPYKMMVEYDTMSIMHFHDRAYSLNGGPTIVPLIPGLIINPSDKLSQLDIMKLRIAFGQECNKRKVGNLYQTCQMALQEDDGQAENSDEDDGSEGKRIESDRDYSPEVELLGTVRASSFCGCRKRRLRDSSEDGQQRSLNIYSTILRSPAKRGDYGKSPILRRSFT